MLTYEMRIYIFYHLQEQNPSLVYNLIRDPNRKRGPDTSETSV